MGRKKLYKNVAEKQKAYRERHGQKKKVPLEIRRGERLGSGIGDVRAKKSDETWEEYHKYIVSRGVTTHKALSKLSKASYFAPQEGESGARRRAGIYIEPEMVEEYYEMRAIYEKTLLAEGRKFKGKRRKNERQIRKGIR